MKQLILLLYLSILFVSANALNNKGFGLMTDRSAYISGEQMLVKIYHPSDQLSKIIYLDLINPHGKRVSGTTLEFNDGQASGFLSLPDSLSSGSYLLRAYLKNSASKTKIIRNLWITNRFSGLDKTRQLSTVESDNAIPEVNTTQIQIKGLEPMYKNNTDGAADIAISNDFLSQIDGPLLIAVTQTTPSFEPISYIWNTTGAKEGITEKKGVVLSGTIVDKKTAAPVPDATVYMTVPDSIPGFQYYQTRDDGRFFFQLQGYSGQVQAFVQCFAKNPAQRLKINMDELFAPMDSLPRFKPLALTDDFKSSVTQNIDAFIFQKIFVQEKLKLQAATKKAPDSYPYYGVPSNVVDPQLFITLPNFSEISKELLPGVKFRNYNNEPSIRVMNPPLHGFFEESPLLLIDGIPIRDVSIIKDMGTTDIKRIEILQSERFYGNLRFPGVVAIYTMKGDYSRIPDTDQLMRVKPDATQVKAALAQPEPTDPTIPDLRQVLYWNPEATATGAFSVKFRTSTILGTFSISVRGKLHDGTLFYAEKYFDVK